VSKVLTWRAIIPKKVESDAMLHAREGANFEERLRGSERKRRQVKMKSYIQLTKCVESWFVQQSISIFDDGVKTIATGFADV
jgi:hypothetical protein